MDRVHAALRNSFCGALALLLIALGHVRRKRKLALAGNVITGIYFHKPRRQLFVRCLNWLKTHGYTFISTKDLLAIIYGGKPAPRGAVWLSFDDGYKELCENVLPVVRERKIPITLFIPSGIVEGDGLFPWLHRNRHAHSHLQATSDAKRTTAGIRDALTVAQLKEIAAYPEVTIGAHTVHHAITLTSSEEEFQFEVREDKHKLELWTGKLVNCFAYPEGRFNGRERHFLVECGYLLAATTENALITPATEPYFIPRFSVADDVSFPEAICNMVGIWRAAIDPIKRRRVRTEALSPITSTSLQTSAEPHS